MPSLMLAAEIPATKPPGTTSAPATPLSRTLLGWLLVVPLLFLCCHGLFSFELASETANSSDSLSGLAPSARGPITRIVLPGLAYAIVLGLVVTNLKRVLATAWRMKILTFLASLTVISSAWSQVPSRTLSTAAFFVLSTLFAYALASRFNSDELTQLLMMCGVAVCCLSLAVVIVLPQYGIVYALRDAGAWRGFFSDRTAAAKCLVFLVSPALVVCRGWFTRRRALYLLLLVSFILKAKSVTSLVVIFFVVSATFLMYASERLGKKLTLLMGSAGLLLLAIFGGLVLANLSGLLALFGRDLTLTGRTEIWGFLLPSIIKHPWLGYGYYAFWLGLSGESANAIIAAHWFFGYAHNGLIEIVLQLGLFGAGVFLLSLFQAIYNACQCLQADNSPEARWYAGLILATIVYNVDEATVMLPHDFLSILYIVACCHLARLARLGKNLKPAREQLS